MIFSSFSVSRRVRAALVGVGILAVAQLACAQGNNTYVDDPDLATMGQAASQPSNSTDNTHPGPSKSANGEGAHHETGDTSTSSQMQGGGNGGKGEGAESGRGASSDRGWHPKRREAQPPGAFQRYAQSATGVDLPIFGSQFFRDAVENFPTPGKLPVPGDYVVGPGDELLIRVWGAVDADVKTVVDRNGQINLPRVGTFTVAGVRAVDLEAYLRGKIGHVFNNFQVNAALGQLRSVQVYVVGPAAEPGVYDLPSQATMLTAVVAAGGPGSNGSMRKVSLRRDGKLISELDIYEFLTQGDKARDIPLQSGDVVVFYPAGPRVAIAGVIDNPGVFELKQKEEPLSRVLQYAGGTTVLTSPQQAQLDRIDSSHPQAPRFVEPFKLDAVGMAQPLRDGDVITLLPLSQRFADTVTLRGHVAYPLRMPFHTGMRVRDLIPNREMLVKPQSLQRRNELVQVQPFYAIKAPKDKAEEDQGSGRSDKAQDDSQPPKPSLSLAAEASQDDAKDAVNWDYAVVQRVEGKYFTSRWISFNLGRALQSADDPNNVELQAGDIVTIFGQDEIQVPQAKRSRLVSVEGEVMAPGIYQLLPGETLAQVMARAGGVTPQAYLYGMEFSRESVRQTQSDNLQEAIARLEEQTTSQVAKVATSSDEAENQRQTQMAQAAAKQQIEALRHIVPNGRLALELKPQMDTLSDLPDVPLEAGDRVIVPTRPGFVTVVGAVANRNALLWKEGRTAGEYLKLAGVQELADRGQSFIVRADGTVVHAADHAGLFGLGGGIEGEDIYPGDAIIVPNQLDFETWGHALTRNLKDWSQILYQFGIGVSSYITIKNNLH